MQVAHFHRKKRPKANFSVEGFYDNVRRELRDKINIEYIVCPYYSNGILRRLINCIYAAFKQREVNHITGDVNYLNMFFNKNRNLVTILDCGPLEKSNGLMHQFYKYFWFTMPVKKAKYIIAISEATKNEILKYVDCNPDKIKVIHVSVSPKFHRADKNFNKEKPIILHLGTAPNKNLSRLIKAVDGLNCKLNIIGMLNDKYLKELKDHNIDYENYVEISDDELFEKYKICDLLFFASTYEGFGMPIVEANIVGRPVLTSNLFSMPEVAGDSALLVDPYKTDKIRNGILKIIDDADYRNELIRKGFKNSERFTLSKIAFEYRQLYKLIYEDNAN
jgi:glycosyltransferase involved in cell wall biosynthesis